MFSETAVFLLVVYCGLILLASLAGGWIPEVVRLTHVRLQVATSFVAGLMLGVGLLHLLPHAWHLLRSIDRAVTWMLAGFLIMFFLQRFFHFHHHDVPDESPEGVAGCCDDSHAPAVRAEEPGRSAGVESGLAEHEAHTLAHKSARQLSWGGAAFGLTLHTLIDGVALAASVEAEIHAQARGWLLGIGTFLVIILHKPFDAMAITTLMSAGGWSRASRHVVNGLFALAIPAGAAVFYLGAGSWGESAILGGALAFAAGTFLCIAASDLLPELQFHSHDRVKLSCALLAGLALAVLIGRVESTGHDEHHEDPIEAPDAAAAPVGRPPATAVLGESAMPTAGRHGTIVRV